MSKRIGKWQRRVNRAERAYRATRNGGTKKVKSFVVGNVSGHPAAPQAPG